MYGTPGIIPYVRVTSDTVSPPPPLSSPIDSRVRSVSSHATDRDSNASNRSSERDARRPSGPLSMEKRIKNIKGHPANESPLPLYTVSTSGEDTLTPPLPIEVDEPPKASINTVEAAPISTPKQYDRMAPETMNTPSASSAAPSYPSPGQSRLNTKLWSHIVTTYNSLSTVTRLMVVSRDLRRTASSARWIRTCILRGNVVGNETPLLWRFCSKADDIEAYWKNYFHVETSYEAYDFLRSDARHPEKAAEIDRDVPRTFPAHPKFQTDHSRLAIQGVLRAISAANPKVGYCQGMNFVVAVFLLHVNFDEAQTTWLVLALMKHYSYDQLYSPGVPLLPLRTFQFSGLIKRNLLSLYAHLEINGFAVDIFSHQWMMTLFAYMIEPDFLGYIWNVIFFVGWKAIFQAGLGIMMLLQDDILKAENLEGISNVVHGQKKRLRQIFETETSPVTKALSKVFHLQKAVKTKELRALEKEYVLQKWDTFLTTDALSPGFMLIPKGSEKPDLLIDANAFACQNSPPWRLVVESHLISNNITVSHDVCKQIQKELLEADSVVKQDVEIFQRRIAASLRELLEFEKTHHVIQQDVYALENCKDEFRQFKQTLIDSLYTTLVGNDEIKQTSLESTPHKETIGGLSEKILDTERNYVALCDRLAAKEDEWTPLREELDELRTKKTMLVQLFTAFLEEAHRKRYAMLEDSWDLASQ